MNGAPGAPGASGLADDDDQRLQPEEIVDALRCFAEDALDREGLPGRRWGSSGWRGSAENSTGSRTGAGKTPSVCLWRPYSNLVPLGFGSGHSRPRAASEPGAPSGTRSMGPIRGERSGPDRARAMSITAKQLSRSGARGKDLDALIQEQLQIIDNKLLRADRTWGRNVVAHDLPTVLSLPGLEKKDAQRIVYTAILLAASTRRGFETALLLEPESSTVYAAWMTDLDVEEVEAMNALIRAKRLTREAVQVFVGRGAAAAPRAASAARQGRAASAPSMSVAEADRVMRPRGGMAVAGNPETRGVPAPVSPAEVALLRAGA